MPLLKAFKVDSNLLYAHKKLLGIFSVFLDLSYSIFIWTCAWENVHARWNCLCDLVHPSIDLTTALYFYFHANGKNKSHARICWNVKFFASSSSINQWVIIGAINNFGLDAKIKWHNYVLFMCRKLYWIWICLHIFNELIMPQRRQILASVPFNNSYSFIKQKKETENKPKKIQISWILAAIYCISGILIAARLFKSE